MLNENIGANVGLICKHFGRDVLIDQKHIFKKPKDYQILTHRILGTKVLVEYMDPCQDQGHSDICMEIYSTRAYQSENITTIFTLQDFARL